MATVFLCPIAAIIQFLDDSGIVLANGTVSTFVGGSSTPAATYTDSTGIDFNPVVIPLNEAGRLSSGIWQAQGTLLKIVVQDSNGVVVGPTFDQIPGINDISATNSTIIGQLIYPISPAEISNSITPASFSFPVGDVRRYGADPTGLLDSSTAFRQAFLVKGVLTAIGTYSVSSGFTMDISTTTLVGPGQVTSNLTANSGAVITVISSGSPESNTAHKISQIFFRGQGFPGVQALNFNTTLNADAAFTVDSCTFNNFADGVIIGNSSFEIEFNGCTFSSCGTDHAGLYVHFPASERISCVQCAFFNSTECLRIDGGGEVFLTNCSLDYSNRLINAQFGIVIATDCYFENGANVGDLDYWFTTGTGDSSIQMSDCIIVQTANKSLFNFGLSQSGYGGSIVWANCKMFSNTNTTVNPIIGGTGNAYARGTLVDGFANSLVAWANFSATQNFCSNGIFTNGTGGLGGWTLSSTDTSRPTAASNTLTLQVAIGGNSQSAYWTISAEPGQNVGFSCNVKGNLATAQFGMTIRAVGADGVTLATSPPVPTFNAFNGSSAPMPTSYTPVRSSFVNLPAGTATVQLELNTLGNTASFNVVSVQSVVVGKY